MNEIQCLLVKYRLPLLPPSTGAYSRDLEYNYDTGIQAFVPYNVSSRHDPACHLTYHSQPQLDPFSMLFQLLRQK
jgi:hypothetical protein